MKRTIRSREFWEETVAHAKASSLTRAAVAKELGVGRPALTYWLGKLRAERRRLGGRSLVPVRVVTEEPAPQAQLELDVGGIVARFSSGTLPGYVAQLAGALRKRRENEVARTKLEISEVDASVPTRELCTCPARGNECLKDVGKGKVSRVLDYVPGYFRRVVYRRQTVKCTCGKYIITASPPEKASEGSRYSEGFVAHPMVSKCGDSIPLYRLEKQYMRAGLNISRATTNELLYRHAELLLPLCQRLFERIAEHDVALADETRIKLHRQSSKAFLRLLGSFLHGGPFGV